MRKLLNIAAVPLLFLGGCMQDNIIDDILMVEAEGYDYIGNDQVIGTITTPNYAQGGVSGSGGGGMPATASLMTSASAITYDGRSLVEKLTPEGQKAIRAGKLRVQLLNEPLLRHGLKKLIQFRNQDPDVGRDLFLVMVDGNSKDLLQSTYQTAIPVSRYIYDLIFQNQQQNYPRSNLSTVLYNYYGYNTDPFMPIIKKEQDHIVLTGIALLKRDQYVGRLNGQQEAFLLKTLIENFNYGFYDYTFEPDQHVVLENVNSSRHYDVKNGNSAEPDIYAAVNIKGYVRQGNPLLATKEYYSKTQSGIQNEIERALEKMVAGFQKMKIDPIGIGDTVRSYTRNFDARSWPERYSHIHFHAKVNAKIIETGISNIR